MFDASQGTHFTCVGNIRSFHLNEEESSLEVTIMVAAVTPNTIRSSSRFNYEVRSTSDETNLYAIPQCGTPAYNFSRSGRDSLLPEKSELRARLNLFATIPLGKGDQPVGTMPIRMIMPTTWYSLEEALHTRYSLQGICGVVDRLAK